MPTKPGTQPGYGAGTRPNPNAAKICIRGFAGCGQHSGQYDPATQKQKGRKQHSVACGVAWKASGAAALQATRSCPRMTRDEVEELKRAAAQQQAALAPAASSASPAEPAPPIQAPPRRAGAPAAEPAASASPAAAAPAGPATGPAASAAISDDAPARAAPAQADPQLKLWAEAEADGGNNSAELLVGLQLRLDFGALGECRGKVTSEKGGMFTVAWTCGPSHNEEFKSQNIGLEGVIGWHLVARDGPPPSLDEDGDKMLDWPEWDDHKTRGKGCPLLGAPAGSKLIDFSLPCDGHEFFPGADTDSDERWWATLARLNDPAAAHAYAPHIRSYPLPWLLTIILVTKEEKGDPSVKIPSLIVAGKQEVYTLADQFARRLAGGSRSRMGYGELAALEGIVRTVAAAVPAAGAKATHASWLRAYTNVEALLLTLSGSFEQADDNWRYADDPPRITSLSASIVLTIGAVLLNPPSEAARDRLTADASHISRHIHAGSFTEDVEADGFGDEHPDAARTWGLLQDIGAQGGASAGEKRDAPGSGKRELSAALKRHKSIKG